jgi:hypothetical protein
MPHFAPGDYRATALVHELRTSKAGNPYSNVTFRLLDAPGQIDWRGNYTSEKLRDRALESLRYCGWKGDDLSNVAFPEGNEVILVIEDDTYEGKIHSQVAWVNSSKASVKNALGTADAKVFAARMKGAILALDAKKNLGAPAETKTPAVAPNGDIPF